ncbi:MAG: transglutaminase [Thiothrix lacustris]|uniref:Transglutaminase n=1 Tax=Thiothrix lacustris TaxID=525917 RepID=A0A1Y1QXH0_9GAMM|nr:MAG: transglutaminase [Thiothrix lacustris]
MHKQITYTGMIWLLAAQVIVMLPFLFDLPLWLLPVLLFAAGWRLRVLSGAALQPGNVTKALLIALGIGGLVLSGLQFPSLDAMATLLLLGFAFKSLEVVQRRDAIVVIFIGYFLVALHFLYAQSITAALYGMVSMIVLTGALIGVQQSVAAFSAGQQVRFNLRLSVFMLLQCLPLMVIIFVVAPRLPPLWSLPAPSGQAKSGVSDRMAAGDIEKLSQSDALAFRVTFKGKRPAQPDLYWRGLVFNHFDGREWRQFERDLDPQQVQSALLTNYRWQADALRVQGEPVAYEAVYEKTGQPWLFTLTPTVEVEGDVVRGADYRVMARQDLQAPFLLLAVSYPDSPRDLTLASELRQLALALPETGDMRTRDLAQRLWRETGTAPAYLDKVLARFQEQRFEYTLKPPLLGERDTIDAFLFEAKRGFCAHYAGSLVFLMRAAGIPARVVVGYQGGEWNPAGEYLAIHQYDAHAWAEVWLAGQGWVRVDPTTRVAPSRTEQGLEAAMQAEGSFLADSVFSVRKIAWLNGIRQQLDTVQYGWRRWVLGYDGAEQAALLKALLGTFSVQGVALLMGGLLAAIGLLWLVLLGMTPRREREALEHQLYRRFCAALAKRGVLREPGDAPGVFAAQAAEALPAVAGVIREFTQVYEGICYAPAADGRQATRRLQALLGKLR